jgi:hypothetical protein
MFGNSHLTVAAHGGGNLTADEVIAHSRKMMH